MAQSTLADRYRTRSRPLTLAALEEYGALSGFQPPTGPFDPQGAWKHTYRIWMVASGGFTPKPTDMHYRGYVEIDRQPLAESKGIVLRVRQSVLQQAPAVGRFLAELILSRPQSLDLSIFTPERILENKPLSEGGLV